MYTSKPLIAQPLSGPSLIVWPVLSQGNAHTQLLFCRASEIAVIDTIFYVFSYDVVLVEIRTYPPPPQHDRICLVLALGKTLR